MTRCIHLHLKTLDMPGTPGAHRSKEAPKYISPRFVKLVPIPAFGKQAECGCPLVGFVVKGSSCPMCKHHGMKAGDLPKDLGGLGADSTEHSRVFKTWEASAQQLIHYDTLGLPRKLRALHVPTSGSDMSEHGDKLLVESLLI